METKVRLHFFVQARIAARWFGLRPTAQSIQSRMREKTFLVPKLPQAYSRPQSLSFLGHEASYKLCRVALGTRIPQAQHNPRIMLGLYHSLR